MRRLVICVLVLHISGEGPGSYQIRKGGAREEWERGGWFLRGVVERGCGGRLLKGVVEGGC